MRSYILSIFLLLAILNSALAQGSFSPQAGEQGSEAILKDTNLFRDWARSCTVERGLKQINQPDSGVVSTGAAVYATGPVDAPLTVSLGDGGIATLQFAADIYNGPGPDFAVFENGFGSGAAAFLELAFVEVSSDGEHYFRFPAISEVPAAVQKASYEYTDASYLHNLAGKHIANFGTPFDLDEIRDTSLLDKQHVSHIRIIDVVGTIDTIHASFDSEGNIINDPWPTSFPQGGFDLDAVGVIHSLIPLAVEELGQKKRHVDEVTYDLYGRRLSRHTRLDFSRQPYVIVKEREKAVVMP